MAADQQGTILYGMMGAGKSTLGEGLAVHLDQALVDTDGLIETRFGRTCGQLVADPVVDFGECQRVTIMAYEPRSPEVIATGGSVAMYPELVGHLAMFGISIFIDVDAAALQERLPAERIAALNNPKGLSFTELYAERAEHYRTAANFTLKVSGAETVDVTLGRLIDLRSSVSA